MSNFKELYNKEIVKTLKDEFKYSSVMEVPRLEKIVINMGVPLLYLITDNMRYCLEISA